jgi:hypothetical protein
MHHQFPKVAIFWLFARTGTAASRTILVGDLTRIINDNAAKKEAEWCGGKPKVRPNGQSPLRQIDEMERRIQEDLSEAKVVRPGLAAAVAADPTRRNEQFHLFIPRATARRSHRGIRPMVYILIPEGKSLLVTPDGDYMYRILGCGPACRQCGKA